MLWRHIDARLPKIYEKLPQHNVCWLLRHDCRRRLLHKEAWKSCLARAWTRDINGGMSRVNLVISDECHDVTAWWVWSRQWTGDANPRMRDLIIAWLSLPVDQISDVDWTWLLRMRVASRCPLTFLQLISFPTLLRRFDLLLPLSATFTIYFASAAYL